MNACARERGFDVAGDLLGVSLRVKVSAQLQRGVALFKRDDAVGAGVEEQRARHLFNVARDRERDQLPALFIRGWAVCHDARLRSGLATSADAVGRITVMDREV